MKFTVAALLLAGALASKDPKQVHIALGHETDSEMTISWVTTSSTKLASVVQYGTSPDDLDHSASGNTTTYTYGSDYTSPYIHHTHIGGLSPDTQYFYSCGDPDYSMSQVFNFTTVPEVGSTQPFSFGVVGDLGQTKYSQATVDHLIADEAQRVILHVGDLSYADGDQSRWDSWGEMMEPLAAHRPYMVGAGNHEQSHDSKTGMGFMPYEHRFAMPEVQPFEEKDYNNYIWGNSFYSFDVVSAHVIVLNTYSNNIEGTVQYNWLEADLKAIDRSVTPWVIVMMHAPWYNSNKAHQSESATKNMKAAMEDLLYKYGANIVMAGHVHAYERNGPVYDGALDDKGPTYITTGEGGNREGHASTWKDQPEYSIFRDGKNFGHGQLLLQNSTHMQWQWHINDEDEYVVSDEAWIVNHSV